MQRPQTTSIIPHWMIKCFFLYAFTEKKKQNFFVMYLWDMFVTVVMLKNTIYWSALKINVKLLMQQWQLQEYQPEKSILDFVLWLNMENILSACSPRSQSNCAENHTTSTSQQNFQLRSLMPFLCSWYYNAYFQNKVVLILWLQTGPVGKALK